MRNKIDDDLRSRRQLTLASGSVAAGAKHSAWTSWVRDWKSTALREGWSVFFGGSLQLQKIDNPSDWDFWEEKPPPEWDSDFIVFGIVYHGTDPVHAHTRELLKFLEPSEWAFIERICNDPTDIEAALRASFGPDAGG